MPKLTASYKLNEEQLKQLKQIVPEAFKDNMLDFNSLYEALSDFLEDDENTELEQFGLSWPGKRQAKRAAAIPPVGTLVPVSGDGIDEETTKNIFIEGDNLEVLKILKKAYTGRIKMIYIDPPYNTGDDFIYPDDFSELIESFQRRTGKLNENNEKMTTNKESDGRFHSKWCSMIYPRLRLARELLSDDGVIFISIDDNEVAQLRKICDELFGEENFISILTIIVKTEGRRYGAFAKTHENVYVYCKNIDYAIFNEIEVEGKEFSYEDDIGGFNLQELRNQNARAFNSINRPNLRYPFYVDISNPDKNGFYKVSVDKVNGYAEVWAITINENDSVWRWGKEKAKANQSTELIARKGSDNIIRIFQKYRKLTEEPKTVWFDKKFISNKGTKELQDILGNGIFNFPKPVALIKQILAIATSSNSIILDFFSGSSTSAHAVMQQNVEDNGNRKFIMVQLPELCKEDSEAVKAGYKNICEIGKERIRRAGKKIKEEAGLNAANLDTGFKVYRLAPSNYKAWENYTGTDVKQLEELFKADSLMQGWKEDDLLTEVMLLEGFPLDSKIELLSQFKENKIKKISSDFRDNTLYICLDKDIVKETIEALNLTDKERIICLDSAIDDQSKIRLEDKNLIKTL